MQNYNVYLRRRFAKASEKAPTEAHQPIVEIVETPKISPEFSEQKTTLTPIDRKRIVKTLVYLERRNQPTYSGRITIRAFGSHRQMTENIFLHFERLPQT